MVDELPIYHRLHSKSAQSDETLEKQIASSEMWGKKHQGGEFPSVKAYHGPLPEGKAGVEFTTELSPEKKGALPKEARWRNPPAVDAEADGYVKIPVKILKYVRSE